jgi:hypothetical protein
MGKPQRRFGKEFAVEAVRLVEVSGRTQKEIARDLGVGLSTLRRYAVRLKKILLDKRLECRVVPHPHTGWIDHPLHLQLGRRSVIDIVADVLLVGENLVDGAARPRSAEIRADAFRIQSRGDLAFGPPLHDKHAVQATRDLHFLRGPRPQHDSVRLKTLLLAPIDDRFRLAMFIDQLAAQPISNWAALTEAKTYQPALSREDLGGKFPAIFARDRTLHALDDGSR